MTSGVRIHQELQDFGGVNALKLEPSIKKELKTDWNLFLIQLSFKLLSKILLF